MGPTVVTEIVALDRGITRTDAWITQDKVEEEALRAATAPVMIIREQKTEGTDGAMIEIAVQTETETGPPLETETMIRKMTVGG